MATTNVPRRELADDAAQEVASIAAVLQARFCSCDAEDLYVRALAIRLEELANVIAGALGDPPAEAATDELRGRLYGPELARQAAAVAVAP